MNRPQRRPSPIRHTVLTLALGLLLLVLLLAGCSFARPQKVDPLADYHLALSPHLTADRAQLAALPVYSITVQINPDTRTYTGTMELTFPVSGTLATNELYFRLYPNLKQFDGRVEVTAANVNGATVNYGYVTEAAGTAVHLAFAKPLREGTQARVRLGFNGEAPQNGNVFYTLFGKSKDILSLMGFYPILAPHRGQDWALDVADPQGDVGFHDAALYRVTVTAPANQVIVASGTQLQQSEAVDGWVTTQFVQGPAREFALLLSPRFQILEEEAYGTRVRSYFLPEDAEAGKSALYYAIAAMEIYSDAFGPYPYGEMSVVEAPLTIRGQEFPGVSLIGSDVYTKYQTELEKLVSHEVAHQWWYNQVGSDQTQGPWLDEGLAEFSMYYYYALLHGVEEADLLRLRRWEAPVELVKSKGTDAPIGRPVASYKQSNYETIIYAKGALFFATLRDEVGPDAFREILRRYLEDYRWRIATPADLRAVAEQVSGRSLGSLFNKWIDGTEG